jgi:hypothetical protein
MTTLQSNSSWADKTTVDDDDCVAAPRLMNRRVLLLAMTLGTFSLPLAARAQRSGRVYRVGVLSPVHAPSYMTPFVEDLRTLGWVEGRDFMLEYRFSGDTPQGADMAARELAALKVDVIVTLVTGNAIAAKSATAEIPIVMMNSGYPVEVGLAKSYARPGGGTSQAILPTRAQRCSESTWRFSGRFYLACGGCQCSGATSRHSFMPARANWHWAS